MQRYEQDLQYYSTEAPRLREKIKDLEKGI